MNIIDSILNGVFTNYDGKQLFGNEYKTTKGDINTLKYMFTTNELMDMIVGYTGEHYKVIVDLAMEYSKFDIAMDIALANYDYTLCKTINYESQKVKINEESKKETKRDYTNYPFPSFEDEFDSSANAIDKLLQKYNKMWELEKKLNKQEADIDTQHQMYEDIVRKFF